MARTIQVIAIGRVLDIVIQVVVLMTPGTHIEKCAFLGQSQLDTSDLLWRNEDFAQYHFGQGGERAD